MHQLSIEATEAYEGSRKKVARFINAPSSQEVVFTRGTTESINLVKFAWGSKFVKKGDVILLTMMEHHSNIVPWQLLAKEKGARIEYAPHHARRAAWTWRSSSGSWALAPALVAFTHCSNVLGTINDAERLCSMAKRAGATTLVDAAQSTPHMAVDVQRIGCDFLAFSGHKMLGPTGIGVLYGGEGEAELDGPVPVRRGHDPRRSTWTGPGGTTSPTSSRRGPRTSRTPSGWAWRWTTSRRWGWTRSGGTRSSSSDTPSRRWRPYPASRSTVRWTWTLDGGVVSFNLADIHPHDMASILDEEGVAIRSGHHCAQPLMELLNVSGTSRASFYVYNSTDDIDVFIGALLKAKKVFCV